MQMKSGLKVRPAVLYSFIAALLFLVAIQRLQIHLLEDSVASRDVDIFNCELDASNSPMPRPYLKAWAPFY